MKRGICLFLTFLTTVTNASQKIDNQSLYCFGTEPHWSLKLDEGSISFDDYQGSALVAKISDIRNSQNHNNVLALSLGSGSYMVLNKSGHCSDDMSDMNFEYEVYIKIDKLYSGCCR
ncbi:hypothetical protein CGH09_23790 [Vibrio parahaemolyticus]|uniref:hypothetical protein n=1 Tax=Vibrio parahaemolyticus TaxID=670 RepID=UPI0005F268F9|nr:hypothetical protein [Vibrio parahaemolyticus]EIU6823060.1 hypothetical protein [Vibrio parahaemolyticus]ELI5395495.1 hypothetical protein [Vibrio parahaemolyticus]MBM5068899.1 hypothetical protein [Vibrio parahaemolyticus]MDG2647032.1 hypothetical protein [Vibrio parahaemolyticus]MDG3394038.1 hypothetical protein [Vibrio parahaemolyticus]